MKHETKFQRTDLYKFYNENGVLLYVGVSISVLRRITNHKDFAHWFSEVKTITRDSYPNRKSALDWEKWCIKTEKPKFNIQHNNEKPPPARPPRKKQIFDIQQDYRR